MKAGACAALPPQVLQVFVPSSTSAWSTSGLRLRYGPRYIRPSRSSPDFCPAWKQPCAGASARQRVPFHIRSLMDGGQRAHKVVRSADLRSSHLGGWSYLMIFRAFMSGLDSRSSSLPPSRTNWIVARQWPAVNQTTRIHWCTIIVRNTSASPG